ncbi:HNH endonuclease [Serratia surfactantfaciens]|uniref:HNH endonuclease n=1 Tax=Serratia surfactantfaciens TaxID=2741499 RepID=UPI0018E4933C|nr:HNH endonuclease [Serratia surfactantfaciens]MBI6151257.1 HNH endonuclease [Serratia surfactantfaciens]HEJ9032853.1 HNH endonuclease [Serratia marcescens]
MAAAKLWTREELLIAFTLYSQIPFGKLHSKNPEIIHYAKLIDRTPSALAMKLVNLASLDPYIIESGRSGLKGASNADRELWKEMSQDMDLFNQQCQTAMEHLEKPAAPEFDEEPKDFSGRDKLSTVKTRVDQNLFRKNVLEAYEYRCCITGLEEPALLVASHILPWSHSIEQRLNPSNGLCLSSLHDKAFDRGLITFDDKLELVLSTQIKKLKSSIYVNNFENYEGKKIRLPLYYHPDNRHLDYHRDNIFLGN